MSKEETVKITCQKCGKVFVSNDYGDTCRKCDEWTRIPDALEEVFYTRRRMDWDYNIVPGFREIIRGFVLGRHTNPSGDSRCPVRVMLENRREVVGYASDTEITGRTAFDLLKVKA